MCCRVFLVEEQKRYQIFKNNMKIAREVQSYDLGTATYGASPFADLTGFYFHVCVKSVVFWLCEALQFVVEIAILVSITVVIQVT